MNTTYSRDMLIESSMNDDEVRIILHALHSGLVKYGWYYNNVQKQSQRDAIATNKRIIKEFTELISLHTPNIFDGITKYGEERLYASDTPVTKAKCIELVKKLMKKEALSYDMKERRYNDIFAKKMLNAFQEWCTNYEIKQYNFDTDEHAQYIIDNGIEYPSDLL